MSRSPSSYFNKPGSPQSISFRPLDKGMFRDLPPNAVPYGGFWTVQGYIARRRGLFRRPGFSTILQGAAVTYPPVKAVISYYQANGSFKLAVLDSKFLYEAGPSSLTRIPWKYDTGTVTVSGTAVTGVSTVWGSNSLFAGDVIVLDPAGIGSGPEEIVVTSFGSDTTLTLATAPAGTYGAGTAYEIHRAFNAQYPYELDWSIVPSGGENYLVITDFTRPPYAWDGATFGAFDAGINFVPRCTTFFGDRAWFGGPLEGNDFRHRLIWSRTLDRKNFTIPTTATQMNLDMPYNDGYMHRVLGLGGLLVQYHTDAVYVGRPTNFGDALPYSFEKLDTGGVGLVGSRAVVPWIDGHFVVGQDDIYWIGANMSIQGIGSPVISETLERCEFPFRIWAAADPVNERIVFGFPTVNEDITNHWSFNTKTQGWSFDQVPSTMISGAVLQFDTTWNSIPDEHWDDSADVPWDSFVSEGAPKKLFTGFADGTIGEQSRPQTQDFATEPITSVFETGELDMELPDKNKIFLRASVKIEQELTERLRFRVSGSKDGGISWRDVGFIVIQPNQREGFVTFKFTGSTCKFRFESQSAVPSYTVSEFVIRAKARDLEFRYAGSSA